MGATVGVGMGGCPWSPVGRCMRTSLSRDAPARAPFPRASAPTPNRPPPHGRARPPTPTAGREWADAARRGRAAGAGAIQISTLAVGFCYAPVAAPRPQPRASATTPLASVGPHGGAGGRPPAAGKLAIGGWARARGRPRRPGETPWRATVAAWSPPQPSLPPAPTSLPRDPDPASPVRRLTVGLVAPLITQTPTLSPRRSSPFRSGPAHRHDSDDGGASLWCALFCLSLGERACAAISRVQRRPPPPFSVVLTALVAARAAFAVRYFGREKERREAAAKKKPTTPVSPSLPKT